VHPLLYHLGLIILILTMVTLLSTGIMDIDWQVNSYHNNQINPNENWYFSPTWKMFWWDAYVFTLMRIIAGSILLGYVIAQVGRSNNKSEDSR
jgi:hypothetical protein